MTSGATHGLHLILSTLVDLAGVVFVDEVTYMIALEAFQQFDSMRIVPGLWLIARCIKIIVWFYCRFFVLVPLNSDGPDLETLGALINKYRFKPTGSKLFWGVYYTIPTFHNPTGILFTEGEFHKWRQMMHRQTVVRVGFLSSIKHIQKYNILMVQSWFDFIHHRSSKNIYALKNGW